MPVVRAEADATERAMARSLVYRFLSVALRPPEEVLAAVDPARWQASLEAVRTVAGGAAAALEAAMDACQRADPSALSDDYQRTFGHQVGMTCPLYEAQYIPGGIFPQAQCLADVAGFYRAFGVEVDEGARERPDHVSLELEFMHVLAYREAYARVHHGPGEVALLQDAQRAFLRDHLARWVPSFARLVAQRAGGPYRSLASALAAWVTAEAEALGAGPVPEVDLAPSGGGEAPDAAPLPCGAGGCLLEPP
ncbi:MAG: molecular chaperone TorD family protein [Armatimonadota bacterium]|nr:molecular chaperone TorD family protein [Armatimonadota bacterium]